jgi:rhamnogalacturonan endolyase
MFRPETGLFTHLATNQDRWGPLPGAEALSKQVVVQDATWDMSGAANDPYVMEVSPYFTKYTFSTPWRKHKAHGMYADGSTTNGSSFGAWLVLDTKDTYFGGPLHSDLVVDGIVYDYISSNHHGDGTPNITLGFDRTFGPVSYLFNSNGSLQTLLADAESATPDWEFYDRVAQYIHGYMPSSQRGSVEVDVKLPKDAKNAIAILSADGVDFQDNVENVKAYQYWEEVDSSGRANIGKVKEGMYRLTVYADGVCILLLFQTT